MSDAKSGISLATVRAKREYLEDQIREAHRGLQALRADCNHLFASRRRYSDEVDYTHGMTQRTWDECSCGDCGAKWIEDL